MPPAINLRITVNNRMKRTAEFIFFAFIAQVAYAGAVDAGCTPVVYVFRHAEDYTPNPPITGGNGPYGQLTQTGATHAKLYPAMIANFHDNHFSLTGEDFCPVQAVYAANPSSGSVINTMNLKGADNAFCTARPLARTVNPSNPDIFPSNTFKSDGTLNNQLFRRMCNDLKNDFTVTNLELMANDPIVFIKIGSNLAGLDEFMGNNPTGEFTPSYDTPVSNALRSALNATAKRQGSSAIFWTSQGMHILGGAIIGNKSAIPQKALKNGISIKDADHEGTPPRNAVYIFKANADLSGFYDTPTVTRVAGQGDETANWVQCFNHVEVGYNIAGNNPPNFFPPNFPTGEIPTGQRYYCGYGLPQSDLGSKPADSCGNGSSNGSSCTTIPDGSCMATGAATDKGCNQQVRIEICNVNVDKTSGSEYGRSHIDGTGQAGAEYGSCIPAGWR